MMVLIINRPSDRQNAAEGEQRGRRGRMHFKAADSGRCVPFSWDMLTYASVGKLAFVWNPASLRYKGKIRERERELKYRVTPKGFIHQSSLKDD